MSNVDNLGRERLPEPILSGARDLGNVANELCERALQDARSQLHPLLQNAELNRLDQRREFLQAFRSALEERIARKLVLWHPDVQAIF
jgi:hypothetical protein